MTTSRKSIPISFEVFPPKKDGEFQTAFATLDKLGALAPAFISVTYGAGGSNSGKTVEIASYIQNTLEIDAVAHMTCVGSKKEDLLAVSGALTRNNVNYVLALREVLAALKEAGVTHVLALRGDRPRDMTDEQFAARDFEHASDMIAYLKELDPELHISAACYPEKHYECFSMQSDLGYLKLKQDAGAGDLISQMFFDNDYFYEFLEKARRKGVTLPIHAGIMPVTSASQLGTSISLSGATIPKAFADMIARYGDSPEDMRKAGIDYAIRQIIDLKQNGVDGIHIYTMNKPKMAAEIMEAIRPL